MSLAKYIKYKDSDVDWLGEVPEHWVIRRVKDLIFKIGSGVTPKGGSEVYVNDGIPFIRSQNVYDDGLWLDNVSFITEEINDRMLNSQIQPNDILINITGASIGRSCIVPVTLKKANINQHIIYLRAKKQVVPYLSNYIKTSSVKGYIMLIQAGSSKEALNMGQTLNIPVLVPSIPEQISIASYLDQKTSAIDRKVSLLEQKIIHYQQLRKSLINETVCRGLDKTVKLKDSGIEWIGRMPKHWAVLRIKDIFNSIAGGTPSTKIDDLWTGKIPWIPSGKVQNNDLYFDCADVFISDVALKTSSTKIAKTNSLLIALTGATCSNIAHLHFDTAINQSIVALLKKNFNLNPRYYFYFLLASKEKIRTLMSGGAQGGINQEDVKFLWIVSPNLTEQNAIATYLNEKTHKIDLIISNITIQIATLKELRKALINDVVTGKLKVTTDD